MMLSEHFDSSEFACHCGCGYMNDGKDVAPTLIDLLEKIRKRCGEILGRDCPLTINSGVRCPEHNANEGGASNSQHLYGLAADVATPEGMTDDEFAAVGEECGADGIGYYNGRIHFDMRGYEARWDFR